MKLDVEKTVKYFQDIIKVNEKNLEKYGDIDREIQHENEALEFVIKTLKNERFYTGDKK
jgi:hypothetical protein